jgi:hypothetical protein
MKQAAPNSRGTLGSSWPGTSDAQPAFHFALTANKTTPPKNPVLIGCGWITTYSFALDSENTIRATRKVVFPFASKTAQKF